VCIVNCGAAHGSSSWCAGRTCNGQRAPAALSFVLFADDEKIGGRLTRIVERFACLDRHAVYGKEGPRLVHERTPDIVLLEFSMPGTDGKQFLESCERRTPIPPVVAGTGCSGSDLVEEKRFLVESYRLGADSYVRMPAEFDELAEEAGQQVGPCGFLLNESPAQRKGRS